MYRVALVLVALTGVSAGGAASSQESRQVLNNLATELLKIAALPANTDTGCAFTNPREGWIFVAGKAMAGEEGRVAIGLDWAPEDEVLMAHEHRGPQTLEAMRYLRAGQHRLRVQCSGGARVENLVVRAVPELLYAKYGSDPQVTEYGQFGLAYLQRHVLPHLNCMVGAGDDPDAVFLNEWKRAGKRYLVEVYASPYFEKSPAEEAFKYWTEKSGLANPVVDGILADEFFRSDDPSFDAITESVKRIRASEQFKGKLFYPYCTSMFGGKTSEAFIGIVLRSGYHFAWERYLPEQPTREAAEKYLDSQLAQEARAWQERIPGSVQQMIVCFGHLLSAPPESVNTHPTVDHKYYMDMQFNILANHPAFDGLYGVMEYLSSYADEEYLRWAMRLYRHYCIEGRRNLLSEAYGYTFAPQHLANPDFEQGVEGWTIQPAETGSITTGRHEGYSWLQGRYPQTAVGDTFLLMRRSAPASNKVSQPIKGLRPGSVYSLKMLTGDYGDLKAEKSNRQKHAVSIQIDQAAIIPAKCFQHVFANCYSHHLGRFKQEHKYWMNFHQTVFQPRAETATLTISDWANPAEPGGPVDQQLAFNFLEVQPYFQE